MTRYDHFIRLMVLASMVLAGMVATAAASLLLALASGVTLDDLMSAQGASLTGFSAGATRLLLAIQHVCLFIAPALFTAWLFRRNDLWKALDLSASPGHRLIVLGVLFLLSAFPLVNLSFMLNERIPLPEWVFALESEAEATLKLILDMPSPWIFLVNLLIIAILPGIGEELVFRGILQKHMSGILRSPVASIWVTAVIFSAIHFQFEGFLPRMVLGVALGYLYHWTGNLWVPIAAHAFNNGLQVAIIYATGMDVTEFDQQSTGQLQAWMLPAGILVMYLLHTQIVKRTTHEPAA